MRNKRCLERSFLFYTEDVSAFTRILSRQLSDTAQQPSHLELLNMVARAAGYRNFQHLRTQAEAFDQLTVSAPTAPQIDFASVQQLSRFFDFKGRLAQWPAKAMQRTTCLWALWSRIPARQELSEQQLNSLLNENHLFHDPALLRRELFDQGFINRTPDCRIYRRIEKKPPTEAAALVRHLNLRQSA